MASPGAPDLYNAFITTVDQMLLSAPVGSDNAFLLPAFVKPSHNAAVTWRQCCIIRFWPPALIPGKTRDLAERSQLKAFPLYPQSLDWRRAMEQVALRNGGTASGALSHARKAREPVACPSESAMQAYAQHKLAATAGDLCRCVGVHETPSVMHAMYLRLCWYPCPDPPTLSAPCTCRLRGCRGLADQGGPGNGLQPALGQSLLLDLCPP